eukprot:939360_1
MTFVKRVVPGRPIVDEMLKDADVLEGVFVSNMVGVVKQLGALSHFSAELFGELSYESKKVFARINPLNERIEVLTRNVPKVEQMFIDSPQTANPNQAQSSYSAKVFAAGNLFTAATRPPSIKNRRAATLKPPPLNEYNQFLDPDSKKKCLALFSNPNFFFEQWLIAEQARQKRSQELRKERKRHHKKLLAEKRKAPVRKAQKIESFKVKEYLADGTVRQTVIGSDNATPANDEQQQISDSPTATTAAAPENAPSGPAAVQAAPATPAVGRKTSGSKRGGPGPPSVPSQETTPPPVLKKMPSVPSVPSAARERNVAAHVAPPPPVSGQAFVAPEVQGAPMAPPSPINARSGPPPPMAPPQVPTQPKVVPPGPPPVAMPGPPPVAVPAGGPPPAAIPAGAPPPVAMPAGAPPPPTLAPPGVPPPRAPPAPSANLMQSMKSAPAQKTTSAPGRGGLLDAIRSGKALKTVKKRGRGSSIKQNPAAATGGTQDLATSIFQVLERRKYIADDEPGSSDEDSDSDWSD